MPHDRKKVGTSPIKGEIGLEPGRHRVKATLGEASAEREYDIPKGELRTADLALQEPPPFVAPAPPTPAPKAPAATAETAPKKSALPSALQPVPSQRRWPLPLAWTAGGVAVLGAGIMAGGYLVSKEEAARGAGVIPAARTRGCAGTAACDTFVDAAASSDTAGTVGVLGLGIGALAASGLFTVAAIGILTDPAGEAPAKQQAAVKDKPVRIEAAPTVGGVVIRATF